MKKMMVMSVSALLLLSSCATYAGAGAYTGSSFGSIIGSAIGGITGGPRGSDIGTLVGMAGGAVVGAAIGQTVDNAQRGKYEDYKSQRQQRTAATQSQSADFEYGNAYDSGYNTTNSGDDRLYGFGESLNSVPEAHQSLEIRNPKVIDASQDGVLTRSEEARVVFEIFNNSSKPVYGVQPLVKEVTGNRHIYVSENVTVESIMPGKGIRYTASVKADSGLKDGEAIFRIGVRQANKDITSLSQEFRISTRKR